MPAANDIDECEIPILTYPTPAHGRYFRFTAIDYYGIGAGLNYMTWNFIVWMLYHTKSRQFSSECKFCTGEDKNVSKYHSTTLLIKLTLKCLIICKYIIALSSLWSLKYTASWLKHGIFPGPSRAEIFHALNSHLHVNHGSLGLPQESQLVSLPRLELGPGQLEPGQVHLAQQAAPVERQAWLQDLDHREQVPTEAHDGLQVDPLWFRVSGWVTQSRNMSV